MENDVTYRQQLQNVAGLSPNPVPSEVEILFQDFERIVGKMSPGAIGGQDKLLLLVSKIPIPLWKSLRELKEDRKQCENFESLKDLLRSKVQENYMEKFILQQRPNLAVNVLETEPQNFQSGKGIGRGKGQGMGKGKGKGTRTISTGKG